MAASDPDRFALAITQQFLYEHGYTQGALSMTTAMVQSAHPFCVPCCCPALAALEREAGLRLKDEVQQGSQLLQVGRGLVAPLRARSLADWASASAPTLTPHKPCSQATESAIFRPPPPQLVYDHVERQLAESARQDPAAVRRRRLEEELLAGGAPPARHPCPSHLQRCIEAVHPSNITSLQCWPARRAAVVGSSDGGVALVAYDGALLWRVPAGGSGVLCLALHPGPVSALVAAGGMDGGVALLDAGSGRVVARGQPHRKYVVAAAWAPDGAHLVTASWDQSFAVHALQRRDRQAGSGATAKPAPGRGDGGTSVEGEWRLITMHTEQTAARVNAVLFLPSSSSSSSSSCCNDSEGGHGRQVASDSWRGQGAPPDGGGALFLLAVQGSNYLRCMRIVGSGSAAKLLPCEPINLNAAGDEHVSFSALHLALSPCGRLLLVSADNGQMLVYERNGKRCRSGAAGRLGVGCTRACHGVPAALPMSRGRRDGRSRGNTTHPFATPLQGGPWCARLWASPQSGSTAPPPRLTAPACTSWRVSVPGPRQLQRHLMQSGSVVASVIEAGHCYAVLMPGLAVLAAHPSLPTLPTHTHATAAAHGALCIFHVGTARRMELLHAHSKTLRTLCYDARANLLLTGSYDRSVKVWEAAGEQSTP
jgi:WD40 repeat protein